MTVVSTPIEFSNDLISPDKIIIEQATTKEDFEDIKTLFLAYQTELGENLDFQDFDHEISSLPGVYGPLENGLLLIGRTQIGKELVCCGSIKKRDIPPKCRDLETEQRLGISGSVNGCEMKRLFILPKFRKLRLGAYLAKLLESLAKKECNYEVMVLDTLPRLESACVLYKKLGFERAEAYYFNPLPGVLYFRKYLV